MSAHSTEHGNNRLASGAARRSVCRSAALGMLVTFTQDCNSREYWIRWEIAARELFTQLKGTFAIFEQSLWLCSEHSSFINHHNGRVIPNKLTWPNETEPVTCEVLEEHALGTEPGIRRGKSCCCLPLRIVCRSKAV